MLKHCNAIPDGFLTAEPGDLEELLGGPCLVHLSGRREPALFVSVMLHGNEPTGFYALQSLLREYADRELPRALSFYVGNVSAARLGLRRLDGQPDYNRVWSGQDDSPEHQMMSQVMTEMKTRGVFASIDIHNNTGLNPHYACVNRLEPAFLQLATLFGRTVVYFTKPDSVQSMAFAELCPAVTLECGLPGQAYGVEHARAFLDGCLNLSEIPSHPVAAHDIDVFHTVAIVTIPDDITFGFDTEGTELQFITDVDHFNFSELPAGTQIGWSRSPQARLVCRGQNGERLDDCFFRYEDGKVLLAKPAMPSMLTLDETVIRQDCFCYLMERFDLTAPRITE